MLKLTHTVDKDCGSYWSELCDSHAELIADTPFSIAIKYGVNRNRKFILDVIMCNTIANYISDYNSDPEFIEVVNLHNGDSIIFKACTVEIKIASADGHSGKMLHIFSTYHKAIVIGMINYVANNINTKFIR